MQNCFYYLRSAIGDASLLEAHQQTIQKILTGDITGKNIEKLTGYNIYSLRLSDAARFLFTIVKIENNSHLLALDFLPSHDYHKSKFLQSGVLEHFIQNNQLQFQAQINEQIFESIREGDELQQMSWSDNPLPTPKPLDFYQKQFIELNLNQKQALNISYPAVISGVAGSGKSCIASSLISSFAYHHTEPQSILYVCQSTALKNLIQQNWEDLPTAQESIHQVEFLSYQELIAQQLPNLPIQWLGQKDCETWFQKWFKNKRHFNSKKIDYLKTIDIYQEFRICSGYEKSTHEKLGRRQTSLTSNLNEFYDLYNHYLNNFKENEIDISFFTFPEESKKYDLIIVDEAQDLSYRALGELKKLTNNKNIVYCVDSHQQLHDQKSIRPYLFDFLKISEHVELSKTHRCPLRVVQAANQIINLKHQLIGGIADRFEVRQIDSMGENNQLGCLYITNPSEIEQSDFANAPKDTQFAVVTQVDFLDEAKELFHSLIVMTPEEIKGLEYETVVAYKLFDKDLLNTLKNAAHINSQEKFSKNRTASDNNAYEEYSTTLNAIYTSYTRAKKMLVICEPEHHWLKNFLIEQMQGFSTPGLPCFDLPPSEPSIQDWEFEILKQLKVQNITLAQNLFLNKVGDLNEFEAFQNKHLLKSPNSIIENFDDKKDRYSPSNHFFSSPSKTNQSKTQTPFNDSTKKHLTKLKNIKKLSSILVLHKICIIHLTN